MTARDVHILDPFTGTGTFLNRLITQKDSNGEYLIRGEDLARKFTGANTAEGAPEIHANEVVLLAYYLAAVKIEEGYNERRGTHEPFEGIVLTDTFEMNSDDKRLPGTTSLKSNSTRSRRQNSIPIRVIVANPPWSAGQKDAGDDNPNVAHPDIEARVKDTYVQRYREVTGRKPGGSAYGNLYIEAFRWASDRLGASEHTDHSEPGVLAFVHPNSLATGTSLAGMRATLRDEFTSTYVVNLRGDAYTSGEQRQKEGDNVFGQGTRNGVQITVLVRNPKSEQTSPGVLRYSEVPEYASLEQKFEWLAQLGDVTSEQFNTVRINDRHDWVNLTDGTYERFLPVCSTKKSKEVAIRAHASGVKTNCDVYVYSFSRNTLIEKIKALIYEYEYTRGRVSEGETIEEATLHTNLETIKWTDALKQSLKRNEAIVFDESRIREVLYRPFTKIWLYEDSSILSRVKTISSMFPRSDPPPPRKRENPRLDAIQLLDLQPPRLRPDRRSQVGRDGSSMSVHPKKTAILISGTSNMTFQALAADTLPDLASVKGSQQTRAIPRR